MAERIADLLESARSIAIATHVNGDGDGWGSACALAFHFADRGADVRLLAATPFPDRLRYLMTRDFELYWPDEQGLEALRTAEVQVVVDASEPARLGDFAPEFDPERTVLIDHHAVASTRLDAAWALIDAAAAASAELVHDILSFCEGPLSLDSARAIYVGLVTDTGSFRYANATPQAHRRAAQLLEIGVDPEELYRPLFANVTLRELEVVEAALARLQIDSELNLVWTALDRSVTALEESELVIDHLRNLQGTEVAVLIRELQDESVKISFRSNGDVDVASIAQAFGGGGHRKAAGANVQGPLETVTREVIEACRSALSDQRAVVQGRVP